LSKWQLIETAPKDSSDFFCTNGFDFGVGYWFEGRSKPFARDSLGDAFTPTLWIPIPKLPEDS